MPSSYGRAIAAAVFLFALTFSPYAHADTSVTPIGDPYTDTLQLWSNIISTVEALAHDLATSLIAIQSHAANSNDQTAQSQHPSGVAQSAAAALATQSGSNTATSSTNQNPFATSGEITTGATSDQTTNSSNVKPAAFDPTNQPAASLPTYNSAAFLPTSPTFDASAFVTQAELNAQLSLLSNVLTAKFSAPATSPFPQEIAADGNNENPFAAVSAINNLSNVTITNANLTASEIPTDIVASNYLPLSGGTLTGTLNVPSLSASSTNYGTITAADASTTNFSNFGTAYFGGTATSSFNSTGALTLASPLAVMSGGTGTTTAAGAALGLGLPEYYAANAGAECNGVHDDTSAINAALAHTGNVILPAGTCVISGTLNVPSNTFLQGAGIDVTIIETSANPNYPAIEFAQTVSDAGVSDLSVNGNSADSGARAADGIWSYDGSSQIKILHDEVYNAAQNGIEVDGSNSEVAYDYVHGNYANGIYDVGSGGTGARSQYNSIHNNDVENNSSGTKSWDGIDIDPNTAYDTVEDNLVVGNDIILYESGASVADSYGHAILDNTIINSNENGIDLSGYLTDIIVSGNRIFNVNGAGILLNSPINNLNLSGNYIDGTSYGTYSFTDGVLIANGSYSGNPSNIEINDNTIKDVGTNSGTGPAILVESGTTNYHIQGNTVTDDRSPVVLTYSADVSGASSSGDIEDNAFIAGADGTINLGSQTPAIITAASGNVGIGTTTPTVSLSIVGNFAPSLITQASILSEPVLTITSNPGTNPGVPGLIFDDSGESAPTGVGGIFSSYFGTNVVGGLVDGMTFISPRDLDGGYSGNANWGFRFNSQSGTTRMFIDTASGNVGIGTTSPGSLLSLQGIANFTTATSTYYSGGGLDLTAGCFAIAGNCLTLGNISGTLGVNQGGTGANTFGQGWIYSTGGTGVLAASSSPTINHLTATSTTATSTFSGPVTFAGEIGIGTTTLNASLTIAGSFTPSANTQASVLSESVPTVVSNPGSNPGVPGIIFNDSGEPVTSSGGIFSSWFGMNVVGGLVDGMTFISPRDTDGGYGGTVNWGFRFNSAGGLTRMFIDTASGNVGIGTTTPYSKLEVWGPDTASTSAFAVVNNASTTVFSVFDSGNATYSGSIFQSSDQRLKTDITSLDASSSLSAIEALNPVSYFRIDQPGTGENLGFIAQQVQQIFPQLVSTTSPTALTPNGTLTLNYEGLISPIVSAIQALYAEVASLENTIAGFAQSFTTNELTFNRAVGDEVDTQTLCLTSGPTDPNPVCLTKGQLAAVLSAAGASQAPESVSSSASADLTNSGNPDNGNSTSGTPPVIQINGADPAIVQAGDTYNDLGATITGPQADLNLGIETYVNGVETSPVQIDTSAAATDTVQYVATDQNGLTSTSTRTVIIEPAAAPSIVPTDDASTTTAATSTTQ